jgi:succinate dehydrogenase/fumarate reductase flavoprotein subunit
MKQYFEVDVLIIGFGAAGANAAIAAYDAGARVLIVEKMAEGGGNSAVCAGFMIIPKSVEDGVEYYTNLAFGTVTEQLTHEFAKAMVAIPELLTKIGIKFKTVLTQVPSFPSLLTSYMNRILVNPTGEQGFEVLLKQVQARGIPVLTNTQAKKLIQCPTSEEIIGLEAEREGIKINISANKAVILACGGYASNSEMIANFNYPGATDYIFSWGSPGNTGDGIYMATQVGASLWHMASLEWGKFCARAPSMKFGSAIGYGLGRTQSVGGFFFVNKKGKRFMPEDTKVTHRKAPLEFLEFDHKNAEYKNLPAFMVFDQTYLNKGSIASTGAGIIRKRGGAIGYPIVRKVYDWSQNNQAEINQGWIIQADSIAELAQAIGIDKEGLSETVTQFNSFSVSQNDSEYGRDSTSLEPLLQPPYYAVELALALVNTQGGPKRNEKCQVLDGREKVIPRLYSAGELGSYFGFLYQGGSNYPEAWASGNTAGRLAASELTR